MKLGRSGPRVDLDIAIWNGSRPERPSAEAIAAGIANRRTKAGVEIMNLGREVSKVKLTLKDVESDLRESSSVQVAVHSQVDSLHEAHVRAPQKAVAVVVRACACDLGVTDEPVEIGDRARHAAVARHGRVGRPRKIQMDIRTTQWVGNQDTPGNGQRPDTGDTTFLQALKGQEGAWGAPARAARPDRPDLPLPRSRFSVELQIEPHRCSPSRRQSAQDVMLIGRRADKTAGRWRLTRLPLSPTRPRSVQIQPACGIAWRSDPGPLSAVVVTR